MVLRYFPGPDGRLATGSVYGDWPGEPYYDERARAVLVHEATAVPQEWGYHGVDGWRLRIGHRTRAMWEHFSDEQKCILAFDAADAGD